MVGWRGTALRWRTLEWWGAGFAIFLQSGALLPLIMGADGLDPSEQAQLRLVALPAYCITGVLLARHAGQLLVALRRSLPLVLLLMLPFASVLWSLSPAITLRRAIALLLSVALAYLLAIRFTPRQLLLLTAAALVPCMVLSLVFAAVLPHLGYMPDGSVRGIFTHKNVLAWYSALSVIVTGAIVADGHLVRRSIALSMFAVCLVCLLASTSATGLVSVMGASCFAVIYTGLGRVHGRQRTLYVLITVQLAAALLITLAEFLVPALEALGKDATLTGRVPLWELVDAEISRHLLLGSGYQVFWTNANPAAWQIWTAVGWPAPHAHNGYRETLLNFGLIGFLVFMFVIARAIVQGARLQCRSSSGGWGWLNVLVASYLLMNLTESLFFTQNSALFILFVTALVMFSVREPDLDREAGLSKSRAQPGPAGPALWPQPISTQPIAIR